MTLALGIDIGTSGVRAVAVDAEGAVLGTGRAPLAPADPVDAEAWWQAVEGALDALFGTVDPGRIGAGAVDGTSGSIVVCDAAGTPVSQGLLYNSGGFDAEAARIAAHAPEGHITRGPFSALARMLRIQDAPGGAHLVHQADLALARLTGRPGVSDENNALKLGWDPAARRWPDWFGAAGVRMDLLPDVRPAGSDVGAISPAMARRFGLPEGMRMAAGTTDSIAAFLAAGVSGEGEAVTSLGTTLAIKLLSTVRVDDAARGIYSHRLGDLWLAGGASNTGGGVLLGHFEAEAIAALSERIDARVPTGFDYYPLSAPGERFPVNDPRLAPRLVPRPQDDALFLQGMLEGIAAIEAAGYAALADLGAPPLRSVATAGGGARNAAWTAIRARTLGVPVTPAPEAEAAVGAARLARGLLDA